MEPDLPSHFNYGVVPPPDFDWEPPRLRRPAWQPTPAQARVARWQLALVSAALALLIFALLVLALNGKF